MNSHRRTTTFLRRTLLALAAAGLLTVPALAAARVSTRAHVASATVVETVTAGTLGKVLAASNGHVLYLFDKDKKNKSSCSGACAKVWKPYLADGGVTAKAGSGLNAKLLGVIKISGGQSQAVYNGHPLYEYVKDKKAAQTNGQGISQFGGDWYVVGPKGKVIQCQPGLVCTY
jgi:predicted lipoprotein with Yx(FWY)xxD motif